MMVKLTGYKFLAWNNLGDTLHKNIKIILKALTLQKNLEETQLVYWPELLEVVCSSLVNHGDDGFHGWFQMKLIVQLGLDFLLLPTHILVKIRGYYCHFPGFCFFLKIRWNFQLMIILTKMLIAAAKTMIL